MKRVPAELRCARCITKSSCSFSNLGYKSPGSSRSWGGIIAREWPRHCDLWRDAHVQKERSEFDLDWQSSMAARSALNARPGAMPACPSEDHRRCAATCRNWSKHYPGNVARGMPSPQNTPHAKGGAPTRAVIIQTAWLCASIKRSWSTGRATSRTPRL